MARKMTEVTAADVQRFQAEGQKVLKEVPDLNDRLNARAEAGFDMHPVVTNEIVRRGRADLGRWLASDEGTFDCRALLNVAGSAQRSLAELNRIEARYDRHRPFDKYEQRPSDVDAYLQKRRDEIKFGRRRR